MASTSFYQPQQRRPYYDVRSGYCPECVTGRLVENRREGDIECSHCGLVVESHVMDERAEWNMYSTKEGSRDGIDRVRVGGPLMRDGDETKQQSTLVVASGNGCGRQGDRLRRTQNAVDRPSDKANSIASELDDMQRVLMAPPLSFSDSNTAMATRIYRGARESTTHTFRDAAALQAACTYYADRHQNLPLFIVFDAFHVAIGQAARGLAIAKKYMETDKSLAPLVNKEVNVFKNILHYCSFEGRQRMDIENCCLALKDMLKDTEMSSKQPRTLDTAILSFVCDEKKLVIPINVLTLYASIDTIKRHKQSIRVILSSGQSQKKIQSPRQSLNNGNNSPTCLVPDEWDVDLERLKND